ncbi:MAG: flippase, partial [Ignavibacteriales bacterium]|nr:flippase [Ignavibacteriales bacterium]
MNLEIVKSIAKNTTVQMGQQLITWASSFILMLFLPRYLGPVNYGRIYLAMSISAIFLMLVNFDGRLGIAKRIARAREDAQETVVNAIGLRIILWVGAFIAMIIFSFIVDYPATVKVLILIFGIEMLWQGVNTVLLGTFLGFETVQYSSRGAVAERVFISVGGVTAVLLGASYVIIAIIMITGTLLNFLICARFTSRIITHLPKFNLTASLGLIKEGIPFLLWTVFGVIYYRVDTVMLSLLTPAVVLGWYGASYKFFDVLVFLPSIYTLSILPILSRLWGKEDGMLARTTQKSLEFIMIAGIPISIGVFAFSEQIIKLFFGLEGYGPSVLNLQIFSIGLLLVYVDMVLGTALFACDKQRQWATVAFFAVIINVSLNYFMIPYFQTHSGNGGVGASIATIMTELFVMVLALAIMPKGIMDKELVPVSLKAIIAGIVMAGSLWLLGKTPVHWIAQAMVSAIVYVLGLFSLKTFKPSEVAFMKSHLSFRNLKTVFVLNKGAN